MNKEHILNTLVTNNLVKTADINLLRTKDSSAEFLAELLKMYEDKFNTYIDSSMSRIKRHLRQTSACSEDELDIVALGYLIDVAYVAIMKKMEPNFLLSLKSFLKVTNHSELLATLGMVTRHDGELLAPIARTVFVKYMARASLFHDLDLRNLIELSQESRETNANLFPEQLLASLLIQKELGDFILAEASGQSAEQKACLWVKVFTERADLIANSLHGQIMYIVSILRTIDLSDNLRQKFFRYLVDEGSCCEFANTMCRGYISGMSKEESQQNVKELDNQTLQKDYAKVCLPALAPIGLRVLVDFSSYKSELDKSSAAIDTLKSSYVSGLSQIHAAKDAIEQRAGDLQRETEQKIADARAQFKPAWQVGFNTGRINF